MTRIRVKRIPPRARGLNESYAAVCQLPLEYGVGHGDGAVITVGAVGWSFGSAFRKATSIAKRITDDPVIKSVMPPQARAGLAAARRLAKAAARGRGTLKRAWATMPPGLRKRTKGLATAMMRKLKKRKGRAMPMEPDEQMPEVEPDEPMPQMPEDEMPEARTDEDIEADAEHGGEA